METALSTERICWDIWYHILSKSFRYFKEKAMGKKHNEPPIESQIQIGPQRLPTQWLMKLLPKSQQIEDSEPLLMIQVITYTGSSVYFLTADEAIDIGDKLSDYAKKIKFGSSLQIVQEIPPHLNNGQRHTHE
jgi:hypothetical protein